MDQEFTEPPAQRFDENQDKDRFEQASLRLGTSARLPPAEVNSIVILFREALMALPEPGPANRGTDLSPFIGQISFPWDRNALLVLRSFIETASDTELTRWRKLLYYTDEGMRFERGDATVEVKSPFTVIEDRKISNAVLRQYLLGCPNYNDGLAPLQFLPEGLHTEDLSHLLSKAHGKVRALTTIFVLLAHIKPIELQSLTTIEEILKTVSIKFLTGLEQPIAVACSKVRTHRSQVLTESHSTYLTNRIDTLDTRLKETFRTLLAIGAPQSALMLRTLLQDEGFMVLAAGNHDAGMKTPATEPFLSPELGLTLYIAPKSSEKSWIAGDIIPCSATLTSIHQRDSLARLDCAHLLIEKGAAIVGMARLWLGIDERTLIVNSIEITEELQDQEAAVRTVVHSFLSHYIQQKIAPLLPETKIPHLHQINIGDSGGVDVSDLPLTSVVVPLGDSPQTRGQWNRGHSDCADTQHIFSSN
jgi:hypothetical protein